MPDKEKLLSQSFALPQKPLRARQSDEQHKVDRHIPKVFAHALGVLTFEQRDLV